jgi:hypothetical protein
MSSEGDLQEAELSGVPLPEREAARVRAGSGTSGSGLRRLITSLRGIHLTGGLPIRQTLP